MFEGFVGETTKVRNVTGDNRSDFESNVLTKTSGQVYRDCHMLAVFKSCISLSDILSMTYGL